MSVKIRPNVDGTTSFLNGSDVEVAKLPATQASANKQIATYGDVIGVGQTWQDVTASRALGVTYTNTTGKPIIAIVRYVSGGINNTITAIVAGFALDISYSSDSGQAISAVAFVKDGDTYRFDGVGGTIQSWRELK